MDPTKLVRDPSSNAIINNDTQGFLRFKQQRERELKMNKTIRDVESLKKDITEIKSMLQQLIGGR